MRLASRPYAFSREKTRNPKRSPANSTDGSGKSKLNFWNARPRGGTKTSLVEVSGRIGGGRGMGAEGRVGMTAPAPAAPISFIQSRRDRGSRMRVAAASGRASGRRLRQLVARRGTEVQTIEALQLPDPLQRRLVEGALSLEGVQHDALEQIAQGHVVVLGQRLEHLDQPLLHAHARLDALARDPLPWHATPPCRTVGTNVPWYAHITIEP